MSPRRAGSYSQKRLCASEFFAFANIMSERPPDSGICERIAQLRGELHGQRGKASFAKQLGISPSTYSYYEGGRVPPADVLVRIADLAGVDLRWLLTGDVSPAAVPADHPAVQRIARLLADRPRAVAPLTAFVDLLSTSLAWPAKEGGTEQRPAEGDEAGQEHGAPPKAQSDKELRKQPAADPQRDWIPILGRSAAGVAQFWDSEDDSAGVTVLADLVARHARRAARQVAAASAADDAGRDAGVAQIITLSAPDAENVAEFVVAGSLKRRFSDAFAVRIDGDSMAPEIRHGDVVICSASGEPAEGRAALVQLDGQIGVTCKIFRHQGDTVHLVPVSEQYPPQAFPAESVRWARRVLARVRPG